MKLSRVAIITREAINEATTLLCSVLEKTHNAQLQLMLKGASGSSQSLLRLNASADAEPSDPPGYSIRKLLFGMPFTKMKGETTVGNLLKRFPGIHFLTLDDGHPNAQRTGLTDAWFKDLQAGLRDDDIRRLSFQAYSFVTRIELNQLSPVMFNVALLQSFFLWEYSKMSFKLADKWLKTQLDNTLGSKVAEVVSRRALQSDTLEEIGRFIEENDENPLRKDYAYLQELAKAIIVLDSPWAMDAIIFRRKAPQPSERREFGMEFMNGVAHECLSKDHLSRVEGYIASWERPSDHEKRIQDMDVELLRNLVTEKGSKWEEGLLKLRPSKFRRSFDFR